MKFPYSVVIILFNPNSTGNSRQNAEKLGRDLRAAAPKAKIRVRPTKRRGHAEAITFRAGLANRHALVISVSGDGGYNEVVNGAMHARQMRRSITVGLVPAGNANDHYATRHRGDLVKRILAADEDTIDLLKLESRSKRRRIVRYGHSYIGLGLTPQAGEKLNAHKLNLWQEIKIVTSVMLHPAPVRIEVEGELRSYNSLIFSNVGRMSKVIRLPEHRDDNGKVEVSHIYSRNKVSLISQLAQATVLGLTTDESVSEFKFRTVRQTSVQIDGEIVRLDAGVGSRVSVAPKTLTCIV